MFTIIGLGSTTTCLLKFLNSKFPQDKIIQSMDEEEKQLLSDDDGEGGGLGRRDSYYGQQYNLDHRNPNEKEIHLNLALGADDLQSQTSHAYNPELDQLKNYFNRIDRGGDMSP